MLSGPILAMIMALPTCYKDRQDLRVPDFLATEAYAIAAEARDVDEAAALGSIMHHEAANCIRVQTKYTHSGAYSVFQLEGKRHLYPQPFLGLNYNPVHNAVYAAVDTWRHTWNCGPGFANRMTSYAGKPCGVEWKTLRERTNTFWYLRSVLVKEIKKSEGFDT
jgi:hypothetical protein